MAPKASLSSAASIRSLPATGWKFTAAPAASLTILAQMLCKRGDRALHNVDLAPELEGEWRVEEDFLAAVKSRGRVRPRPNFEEGVRYMRVVQAVADSRARNEWVEIKK